ncbi:MAG: hypothetical protein P8Y01_16425 [Woeseiaceae bacterium]
MSCHSGMSLPRCRGIAVASATDPVTCSSVRRAIPRKPYFSLMISPCSVTRRRPLTVPGGAPSTAVCVLLPPRLTDPPRPWNSVNSMSSLSIAWTSISWAFWMAQRDEAMPPSLLLSE